MNHHLHHHHHLAFLRLRTLIHTSLHHAIHLLHLYFLLSFKCSYGFFLRECWNIITARISSLLLHLHYLHSFHLILTMISHIFLEIHFGKTNFFNDFLQFTLNEHFFFLSHGHHYIFVLFVVILFQSSTSLSDELLLFDFELIFTIK